MTGVVVSGKRIGTLLGFPTANIELDGKSEPPSRDGVYLAKISFGGESFFAIVNQGKHPTFPEGEKTIEAHIIDFSGDLYGKNVNLDYIRFMRPEQRFSSAEALRARIKADEDEARREIQKYENGAKDSNN